MITPDQMNMVYEALDQTGTLAFEQIVALGGDGSQQSRDEWSRRMSDTAPEILSSWRSVGVDIMAGSLDATTALGVSAAAMDRATLLTPERVAALVGYVARTATDPNSGLMKLAGIGQKLVQEGPRSYSSALSEENGTTARRFAQPGACEWCRYIAVQEHRYDHYGSEWVTTNKADRFHEHCRCVLIPASEYIEPAYIKDWDDEVNAVAAQMKKKYGRKTRKGTIRGGGYGDSTWKEYLSLMRKTGK